jgi:nitrite reductase (NADH) small subunit
MGTLVTVAKVSQLKEGEGVVVLARQEEIALFKLDGTVYAVTNTCPHRGGPIGEGSLNGCLVTCPWHGWEFDVRSGRMPASPTIGLKTFRVQLDGDDVNVEI